VCYLSDNRSTHPRSAAFKVSTAVLGPSNWQSYLSIENMAVQALSCQLCRLMFTGMIVDESRWCKNDHDRLYTRAPMIEIQHETRTEQYLVFRPFHNLQAHYGLGAAFRGPDDTRSRNSDLDDRKRLTVRSMISAYSITCTLEVWLC
jgi:hypothetical protein